MTIRPNGVPCWLDLGSSDTDKTRQFYGELFGWAGEANPDFGGYINFQKDGHPVAGCMANDGTMGSDGWSIYLATDDIAKVAELAPDHGGAVAQPPMPVGDLGQMAFLTDRGGAFVGVWQPGEHHGFEERAKHGTPGWFELWTRDFEGAIAFYRDVVGATVELTSDTDELRYAIIMEGPDQAAGIMDVTTFLPAEVPAHWSVYIAVDDADATIAKAIELGGAVQQPAEDTPYGRLATLTDSTGATIKLVENNVEG